MPDPKQKRRVSEDVDYASYLRPEPEQDASTETYWEEHPETKPPWDGRWEPAQARQEPWYPSPEQHEQLPLDRSRRNPPSASTEWDDIVDSVMKKRY